MIRVLLAFFGFVLLISCNQKPSDSRSPQNSQKTTEQHSTDSTQQKAAFAIAIHGGAGNIRRGHLSDSLEKAYTAKLRQAISTGHQVLKNGGKAREAVQASIKVMENSPLFNSAKGAVLTHQEKPSLDASIMDGKTLNAGAVAGVSHIKNPIELAQAVMIHSDHVLLSGEGAEAFARQQGFKELPEDYFITSKQLRRIKRVKKRQENETALRYDPVLKAEKLGTVGCVALDKNGNLAAGTSTGGMTNKKFGRIGDSPIIGAGTYANNTTCAVSCTGWGEFYIRGVVAYDMSALMEYKGLSVTAAAKKISHQKQPELGGHGGIIAMDASGNTVLDFNTPGMFRAKMDAEGNVEVSLYGEGE